MEIRDLLFLGAGVWLTVYVFRLKKFFKCPGIIRGRMNSKKFFSTEKRVFYFRFKLGWIIVFCVLLLFPFAFRLLKLISRKAVFDDTYKNTGEAMKSVQHIITIENKIQNLKLFSIVCAPSLKRLRIVEGVDIFPNLEELAEFEELNLGHSITMPGYVIDDEFYLPPQE